MPNSINAVLIIALVLAPGYITLWIVRQRIDQFTVWSDVEFLTATIAVGVVIQAIAFPWLGDAVTSDYADRNISNEYCLVLWFVQILVVTPLALGTGISWVINKHESRLSIFGLNATARIPRAWTHCFRQEEGTYVRVWLADKPETVIGGKFSTRSFASTDNDFPDLFIEEVWELDKDDWFARPATHSAGIWISPSAISRIEFTRQGESDE